MKKKTIFFVAVIAVTLATVKTGYAYFDNSLKNIKTEQTNVMKLTYNNTNSPIQETVIQTKSTVSNEENNKIENSYNGGSCCGSGLGNMIDESGDFKDRETYEKELSDSVQSGKISDADKENSLSLYDQCIGTLDDNASN